MNRDALYYLEYLDAFEIMETHIMDRVMQEYWQGGLDASGSILGRSTCYNILTHFGERYRMDYEHTYRFYKRPDQNSGSQPHMLSFKVYRESMQVRYFLEMAALLWLTISFQLKTLSFAEDYNTFRDTYNRFIYLETVIYEGDNATEYW